MTGSLSAEQRKREARKSAGEGRGVGAGPKDLTVKAEKHSKERAQQQASDISASGKEEASASGGLPSEASKLRARDMREQFRRAQRQAAGDRTESDRQTPRDVFRRIPERTKQRRGPGLIVG